MRFQKSGMKLPVRVTLAIFRQRRFSATQRQDYLRPALTIVAGAYNVGMPSYINSYEIAIQKFGEALKFTGSAYGKPYSDVVEGLRQTVQGLLQERQELVERLVAIENLLRNR